MRSVSITAQKEEADFAQCAAIHMNNNTQHYTYAEGDPEPGSLLAIRWNRHSVLVVRLHDNHVPARYSAEELIGSALPTLTPKY